MDTTNLEKQNFFEKDDDKKFEWIFSAGPQMKRALFDRHTDW